MSRLTRRTFTAGLLLTAPLTACRAPTDDPLPSWAEAPAKHAILAYVAKVTTEGRDLVPPAERIAVFDNDGTLWCEQPIYTQFAFAMERVRRMAAEDPALRARPAIAAVADNDLAKLDARALMEVAVAAQAGLSVGAYEALVREWLKTARHPRFDRPYTELIYQPQLELLAYLRKSGFKTYIVSGGDVVFMRTFAQTAYGVPPEQVIGTSVKTAYAMSGAVPTLTFEAELQSLDDGPGKPSNIALHIGRSPLVAVGNSDGDQQMLQYSAASARPNLQMLVHHDDGEREYAYDRASPVGRLDKALDEARARGWTVVSMRDDWRTVFPVAAPAKK